MSDTRHKNVVWRIGDGPISIEMATVAVLLDIRDELQEVNRKLGCWRVPRALNALIEFGKAERHRLHSRRAKAKRRKA